MPVPDEAGVAARLLARGWAVATGARFRLRSAPAIRVTVTGLDQDAVREFAEAVVEAARPPATAPTY